MKYKLKVYIIMYYLVFIANWFFVYRNVNYNTSNFNILDTLTTALAGYNYIMMHSSIYAFMFMLFLNEKLKDYNEQHLIRLKRKGYMNYVLKDTIKISIIFNLIFSSVRFALVIFFQKFEFLITTNFFIAIIISFIITTIYYIIIGCVFSLLSVIISSRTKSIIFTFIISVILAGVYKVLRIWTPISELCISDDIMNRGLNIVNLITIFIKYSMIIITLNYITLQVFKVKDVLTSEGL